LTTVEITYFLLNIIKKTSFALPKKNIMHTIDEHYKKFYELLCVEKVFINPFVSYENICKALGIPEEAMETYLEQELGIGGQELIASLRQSFLSRIEKKYGIDASILI